MDIHPNPGLATKNNTLYDNLQPPVLTKLFNSTKKIQLMQGKFDTDTTYKTTSTSARTTSFQKDSYPNVHQQFPRKTHNFFTCTQTKTHLWTHLPQASHSRIPPDDKNISKRKLSFMVQSLATVLSNRLYEKTFPTVILR